MATRAGFFLFLGLVLGAIAGNWLPFAASLEALAGGVLGVVLALVLDKLGKRKSAE